MKNWIPFQSHLEFPATFQWREQVLRRSPQRSHPFQKLSTS